MTIGRGQNLYIGGINMYGGYNENGVRDIANTPTIFTFDWKVELWTTMGSAGSFFGYPSNQMASVIDGFTFSGNRLLYIENSTSMTLSHNIFDSGLSIIDSSVTLMNNTFNYGINITGAVPLASYNIQSHVTSINNNYNSPYAVNDINGYGASTFESINDYFAGDVLPTIVGRISPNNSGVVTATVVDAIANLIIYTL